jgi:hypothetical protein
MPIVKTLLVYALLGPPIGWVVYMLGWLVTDPRNWSSLETVGYLLGVLLLGIPVAYFVGVIPALVAAFLTIAVARMWGRADVWRVAGIGLLCGLGFAFVFARDFRGLEFGWQVFIGAVKVLTCLVPTLICWTIARPRNAEVSQVRNEAV